MSRKLSSGDIQITKELLVPNKRIVLCSHYNPDGDAVGSVLGLRGVLLEMNHHVEVILPNMMPSFYRFMEGSETVKYFSHQQQECEELLVNAEVIFLLDFNHIGRLGEKMSAFFEGLKCPMVMIDHHQQPSDMATVLFSDTSFTSTCEMVYHFVTQMHWQAFLKLPAMECIYAGMVTDTASFRFPVVTAETHRIVAEMLDKGLDHAKIHQAIYDTQSENRLRLVGYALSSKLEVWKDRGVAVVYLSQEELERFHHQSGDTEGLVNQALSIDGVHLAAFFKESPDEGKIKCSFRSQGDFDVNTFARTYWNGGGHYNAAGGHFQGTLIEAVDRFKELTK
jgi:phosphoesterase RecJ-like protein